MNTPKTLLSGNDYRDRLDAEAEHEARAIHRAFHSLTARHHHARSGRAGLGGGRAADRKNEMLIEKGKTNE